MLIRKYKSSEEVSLPLFIFMGAQTFSWVVYGMLIGNYFILIPNIIGFTLSILTSITIIYYNKNKLDTVPC